LCHSWPDFLVGQLGVICRPARSSANSFIIYDCHPLKDALDQTKRVAGNPEHAFVDAGYRGHLKGVVSEQLNAFLNSAGMNFHKLLRWKAAFLRQIFYWLLSYQRATTIAANSAKWAFQDRLLQKGLTRSILFVDADDLASAIKPNFGDF